MEQPEKSAMYCAQCGKPMETGARFCPACGMVREAIAYRAARVGQLVRSRSRRVIAGICGGLSEHYGWDLSLIRIVAAVSAVFSGIGLVAYVVAWIVIPDGQYALPFGTPMPPPPPPGTTGTAAS